MTWSPRHEPVILGRNRPWRHKRPLLCLAARPDERLRRGRLLWRRPYDVVAAMTDRESRRDYGFACIILACVLVAAVGGLWGLALWIGGLP